MTPRPLCLLAALASTGALADCRAVAVDGEFSVVCEAQPNPRLAPFYVPNGSFLPPPENPPVFPGTVAVRPISVWTTRTLPPVPRLGGR